MDHNNHNNILDNLFPSEYRTQLLELEEKVSELNFDVFVLGELTNGHPLLWMGLAVFKHHNLFCHFNFSVENFVHFLIDIENLYHKQNPYHNNFHAADVTHTTHYLLTGGGLGQNFSKLEVAAILISAIAHDVDHPGFNNNFLMSTLHPIAITHNDNSVLENHHCSVAFLNLYKQNNNFIQALPAQEQATLRKYIIYLILGTDFGKHGVYVDEFKRYITRGLPMEKEADRIFFLLIILKCADLGHTTKSFHIHTKWSYRITAEMICQADEEVKRGFNPIITRSASVETSQIGFIKSLVFPLFTMLDEHYPSFNFCVSQLMENLQYWEKVIKHNSTHLNPNDNHHP